MNIGKVIWFTICFVGMVLIIPFVILDELRKKPHKSSVCGMNCVFFRILFVYF